jgi:hypothetical protein
VSLSTLIKTVCVKLRSRVNGEALLNENYTRYDERNGYTYHEIGQSKIVVQFGRVLIRACIFFLKQIDLFHVSTTLHGFNHETPALG